MAESGLGDGPMALRTGLLTTILGGLLACQPGDVDLGFRPASLSETGPRRARLAEARIVIDTSHTLHPASPFTNGFNRNHNHRQFAVHGLDRGRWLAALRQLAPTWGDAWLLSQQRAGYPANPARRTSYRLGHGPTDGRTDYGYMPGYRFLACWGQDGQAATWDGYPYDDMRYPLAEADEIGAEPLVTVNFGTDTPAAAAALATWLNAPTAALREAHPFFGPPGSAREARGSYMFEIGNEVQLRVVRGHERALTVPMYVREARPYVEALRAGSAHPVKVALAAAVNVYWGGPNDAGRGEAWPQQGAMVTAFLAAARQEGVRFDALQLHGYPSWPVAERLAGNAYLERLMHTQLLPALARAPHPVEIWNDEFHAASGLPRNTGIYGALYAADAAVVAFRTTLGGRQVVPVTTDFAAWHAGRGGASDSLYFADSRLDRPTPLYAFRRLLASNWGDWIVATEVVNAPTWVDAGRHGEQTPVSHLAAVASRTEAGVVHVLVVNRSRTPCEAWLMSPAGQPLAARATRHVIRPLRQAGEPWDAAWHEVEVREGEAVKAASALSFPAASITLLTLRP
ncbi:MAG: hypothetical protein VKS61_12965 [Candidatus Sericytochromatia bacterium]|nr:hypothetical protein [Candidatus Sericytochromatia bacterium]